MCWCMVINLWWLLPIESLSAIIAPWPCEMLCPEWEKYRVGSVFPVPICRRCDIDVLSSRMSIESNRELYLSDCSATTHSNRKSTARRADYWSLRYFLWVSLPDTVYGTLYDLFRSRWRTKPMEWYHRNRTLATEYSIHPLLSDSLYASICFRPCRSS